MSKLGTPQASLPIARLSGWTSWGDTVPRVWLELQKMDRNRDGVVTIDEFLETCQKVGGSRGLGDAPHLATSGPCALLPLASTALSVPAALPGARSLPYSLLPQIPTGRLSPTPRLICSLALPHSVTQVPVQGSEFSESEAGRPHSPGCSDRLPALPTGPEHHEFHAAV